MKSLALLLLFLTFMTSSQAESRLDGVRKRVKTPLSKTLLKQGLTLGESVYLRVFKKEGELEVWVKSGKAYSLFKTYPIAGMSGKLGPKLKEGDYQAPEGFYSVTKRSLNPKSSYHLSFNIGYPNTYDQAHGRTGSFIMVHGSNVSAGCYAMTDPGIEEIYLIVEAALNNGNKAVPFHSFPFRYENNKWAMKTSRLKGFWNELKPAYESFQKTKRPPSISVEGVKYVIKPG